MLIALHLFRERSSEGHQVRRSSVEANFRIQDFDNFSRRIGFFGISVGRLLHLVVAAARDRPPPTVLELHFVILESEGRFRFRQRGSELKRRPLRSQRLRRTWTILRENRVDDGVDQRLVEKFVSLGVHLVLLGGLAAGPAVARAVLLGGVARRSLQSLLVFLFSLGFRVLLLVVGVAILDAAQLGEIQL